MRTSLACVLSLLLADCASAFAFPWASGNQQQQTHSPFVGKRATNESDDKYDYVVVGSGPGGGPVAVNLAKAGYKVLLIDAGGDSGDAPVERVPALHTFASEFEDQQWSFFVNHYADLERQKRDSKMTYELPNGSYYVGFDPPADASPLGINYPRSGTLGGCSRHNAQVTIAAHDSDWEYLAELTNDSTWSADNMRAYYQKIEKNEYLPSSVVGHGYNGWLVTSLTSLHLVVEDFKFLSLVVGVASAFGESLLTSVVSTVSGLASVLTEDINAPGQTSVEGYYQVPLAMNDSVRGGPRDMILETANAVNADGSRTYHLDIKLNTLVSKVRFDNATTPRAIGVDYLEGQSLYRADPRSGNAASTGSGSIDVNKEVIVAGGVFNTPQILKLSGVGGREELESWGIPVVVDLPGVGTNMQDRYEATVIGKADSNFSLTQDCTFLNGDDPCYDAWLNGAGKLEKGVYATSGIAIARTFKSSVAEDDEPDMLISGAPAFFKGYYPNYAAEGLEDRMHWAYFMLKAHSRNRAGNVTLRSLDPRDTPIINFNSFDSGTNDNGEGAKDLQAMYEGYQYLRRAYDDLVDLDGKFDVVWPTADIDTEDEVKTFLQDEAWGHHASCSCPIGADDDPMAALDGNFRVRGTEGLRVVDASVFPKIPGYFIVLPLYQVSAKASDVILADADKW